jgi:tetratricopeptide (TPR) repeat protein
MDLEQRLNQLESQHDWHGLAQTLEQFIQGTQDAAVKAELNLRLGRLRANQFLQGGKALKHFQDAYKLNPALVVALAEARRVYWEVGKPNMVQKLLDLELKASGDDDRRWQLHRELADVLCDQGDYERATENYARALQTSKGQAPGIGDLLEDVQIAEDQWQDRVALLEGTTTGTDASFRSWAGVSSSSGLPESIRGSIFRPSLASAGQGGSR